MHCLGLDQEFQLAKIPVQTLGGTPDGDLEGPRSRGKKKVQSRSAYDSTVTWHHLAIHDYHVLFIFIYYYLILLAITNIYVHLLLSIRSAGMPLVPTFDPFFHMPWKYQNLIGRGPQMFPTSDHARFLPQL